MALLLITRTHSAAHVCRHVSPIAEFSFFNHSCVPNCINWVLPGEPRAMVVRAARHIPAGALGKGLGHLIYECGCVWEESALRDSNASQQVQNRKSGGTCVGVCP